MNNADDKLILERGAKILEEPSPKRKEYSIKARTGQITEDADELREDTPQELYSRSEEKTQEPVSPVTGQNYLVNSNTNDSIQNEIFDEQLNFKFESNETNNNELIVN